MVCHPKTCSVPGDNLASLDQAPNVDDFLAYFDDDNLLNPNGNAANQGMMQIPNYFNNANMNGNDPANAQAWPPPIDNAQALLPQIEALPNHRIELPELEQNLREASIHEKEENSKPSGQEDPQAVKKENEHPKTMNLMSVALPGVYDVPEQSNHNAQHPQNQPSNMRLEHRESRDSRQKPRPSYVAPEEVCPCTLQGHQCGHHGRQYAPKKLSGPIPRADNALDQQIVHSSRSAPRN